MSPEQARGECVGPASDIFSLGCLLYEMVSGRRAFPGKTPAESTSSILRDTPAQLAPSRADLPREVERLVFRCLGKNVEERFHSARDLAFQLREILLAADAPAGGGSPAEGTGEAGRPASIAVLPFANMSPDPEQEYFSDGLAEEIINALAQVPGLKVIARTSAFTFKGKQEDVRGIAERLGVAHVLKGSVRKAGNRVRITAQLVTARDGSHVWSERYDRHLTDIFAVQDEIASAITGRLRAKLGVASEARPQYSPKLFAYEAMLKGRHLLYSQTPASVERARSFLEQAAALDTRYVESHAALANYYALACVHGIHPAQEVMPLFRAEARKILAIDPADAMGHTFLGVYAGLYEYDWREAGERFRVAMNAGPATGDLRAWYAASCLMPQGRYRESAEQFRLAVETDSLNVFWRAVAAGLFWNAGMYDRAQEELRQGLEIDENHWYLHYVTSFGCAARGMVSEALPAAERAYRLAPSQPRVIGMLAGLLAGTGETARVTELVQQLKTNAAIGMVFYYIEPVPFSGVFHSSCRGARGGAVMKEVSGTWGVWRRTRSGVSTGYEGHFPQPTGSISDNRVGCGLASA